ncbi:MAG TPA: PEGA domain-containing protein [Planctomycetota bacterium]|nr:PEGA domain-containing protein [Planctomycetota bacterium]
MNRLRFLFVLIPLLSLGCVERSMVIRSDPPGADLFIDGQRVGVTPHVQPYVWYGTREVTLAMPGYRTERRMVALNAPWWQIFPFDLITDLLVPFTLTDKLEVDIPLRKEPAEAGALNETLERAEEARRKAALPPDAPK